MKKPSRKFWLLLVKISGALYILYALLGFFVAPKVIDHLLENRVAEQLERSIALEEAAFNPFTLSVELLGLTVEDDDGNAFIEIGRVFTNPQIFPLVTRRVSVKEFSLSDTVLRAKLESDGTTNIDRLLEFPESEAEEGPSTPFRFSVDLINIDNVSVEVADLTRTLPFEETIGPLTFVAENLKSDLNSDSPYDFVAFLSDETTIKWEGDVSVNPIASSGDFSIENLDISKAKSFWHDLLRAEIEGGFSMSGSYGLKFDGEGEAAFLNQGQIVLSNFSLDDPEEETQVAFGELRIDGVEAKWPEYQLIVDSVTLAEPTAIVVRDEMGEIKTPMREVAVAPSSSTAVAGSGTVAGSSDAEVDMDVLINRLSVDAGSVDVIDRAISEEPEISLTGIGLNASNIAPFDESSTAELELALVVNGSGAMKVNAEANIPNLTARGQVSLSGLDLSTFQNYVTVYSNAEIEEGSLSLDINYDADLSNTAFEVMADVNLDSISVKELNGGGPVFEAASVSIENARYANDSVTVKRIEIDHPVTTVALDKEGTSLGRLMKNDGSDTEEVVEEVSSEEPVESLMPITIGEIAIVEGRNDLIDNTLEPSHRSSMTGLNLTVENVSTVEGEKAKVSISGGFDRGGSLSFSGNLEPLDFKNFSSLKLDLSSFDLSATAPYWRKYLGRDLDKGMLNVDASFDIKESLLDGSNGIMIDQLTLGDKVESEDSLGLPIGLAVAILKDRQGKMELPPLKLSGDLEDPSISISGIVMKALGNIIIKVATSPFAVLGGIAGGSGNEDLSTLLFGVGTIELSSSQQSQLDKMAKILEERPGLKVDLSARLDESPETKVLQRILISNKSMENEGAEIENLDPIAMLASYDESGYEEKVIAVYRDIMGIPDPVLEEEALAESEPPSETVSEPETSNSEPAKKGLLGSVGSFLKGITGGKQNEAPEETTAVEPVDDVPADDAPEIVVELPPFPEIEAHLFAEPEFQVDPSWLERLAQKRTTKVKDYLVATKGIDASRVFISGSSGDESEEADAKPISAVKFELTD